MRISVIGSNGQLGTDLVKILGDNHDVQSLSRMQADVTDKDSLARAFEGFGPDWVINTAAYHKVDLCEQNPEIAFQVNSQGAENVALASKAVGSRTVFISTDYVFSGERDFSQSYSETDPTDPISVYGKSKLEGEFATLSVDPSNLVGRISSVFGSAGSSGKGGNFVEAIVAKLRGGEKPGVINDTRMSPTYTVSASRAIERLMEQSREGTFHVSNSGSTSWFAFAEQIASRIGHPGSVEPLKQSGEASHIRPKNSSLDTKRINAILSPETWEQALDAYLIEKGYL